MRESGGEKTYDSFVPREMKKNPNQRDRRTGSTDTHSEQQMSCLKLVCNSSSSSSFDKVLPLTCRPSALHRPLLVLVGAMVTTGGVLGTPWPRL